jgi:branched-subunit amino acid aminotransferase/4-amino-4-deoxychorismate lyase
MEVASMDAEVYPGSLKAAKELVARARNIARLEQRARRLGMQLNDVLASLKLAKRELRQLAEDRVAPVMELRDGGELP